MEQESQDTDFLYDFLYVDQNRASSLIAQLHSPGVATIVKQTSSDADKKVNDLGVSAAGIVKGKIATEEAITKTQERQYDASWSLPINLLDKLDEVHLIMKGLNGERLGNTVHIKGRIRIFDISMMRKTLPFMGVLAKQKSPVLPPKAKKQNNQEDIEIMPGLTLSMMTVVLDMVPNTLQVDFVDSDGKTMWMTINRDYLTVNPDDMVLKYGGVIPGEWHVIGLIDALPDNIVTTDDKESEAPFPENPFKDGLLTLLNAIRSNAGRSPSSYGMTPLIIFRTIS